MKNKGLFIGLGLIVVLAISIVMWAMGVSNRENNLRLTGMAQAKKCEAYFDKMWKVLQQDAKVADQYKDAFKDIYTGLIEGRYANDGKAGKETLMKWIQESNPTFSTAMYEKLMVSIEAQREGFFMEQTKLIDIDREHKAIRQNYPSKWIVGSRKDLEFKIITSLKTEKVYESGQENDIELFEDKSKK